MDEGATRRASSSACSASRTSTPSTWWWTTSRSTASSPSGEDVADLGGCTLLAYRAWRRSHLRSEARGGRRALAHEQQFFIGYAQRACENDRPENLRVSAATPTPTRRGSLPNQRHRVEPGRVPAGVRLQGRPADGARDAVQGLVRARLVKVSPEQVPSSRPARTAAVVPANFTPATWVPSGARRCQRTSALREQVDRALDAVEGEPPPRRPSRRGCLSFIRHPLPLTSMIWPWEGPLAPGDVHVHAEQAGRRRRRRFSVRSLERSQPEILWATATISSAATGFTR